jgi:hypothetical protein
MFCRTLSVASCAAAIYTLPELRHHRRAVEPGSEPRASAWGKVFDG